MPILPIACTVQNYAWGSTTSIPERLKQENPDRSPWAELWMGAHSRASSTMPDGQSLADYIAAAPAARLGKAGQEFGDTLPFLFKILAAAAPLSIQCHPNREQARAGYDAEDAAGIAVDAPHRNYRDRNHKPELIVALEEFWALKGFRAPDEIRKLFTQAKVRRIDALLDELTGEGGLRAFFGGLLALDEEDKRATLGELSEGVDALPEPEARWTRDFLDRYPDDIGATAALVLQLVTLKAGQGLYLGAGELHAYLQGTGLEIMANSDNVLRGGLTPKHMDPDELMQVLRFEHEVLQIVEPTTAGKEANYLTPCREFALSSVSLDATPHEHPVVSATIFLSLGGSSELSWQGGSVSLSEGEVAFATADTGEVSMRGDARLWVASIGSSAT
jgi:mannose-6-phosphate isomerase